jgi:hypothetical protein
LRGTLREHIVHKYGCCLIAVEQYEVSVVVSHRDSHPVAVGIASDDKVVPKFFGAGHSKGERGGFLGIG